MYAATPGAAATWAELFGFAAARSGVALAVRPHPAPAPMAAPWRRGAASVFMKSGSGTVRMR